MIATRPHSFEFLLHLQAINALCCVGMIMTVIILLLSWFLAKQHTSISCDVNCVGVVFLLYKTKITFCRANKKGGS